MTPEDIERLGYGSETIWLQLEQEVMQDIARRIKQTGVVTRSADYQLNQIQSIMGYSDKQMKELLKETMATSDTYINKVFDEAVKTDYIDNKELYKATGTKFIPYAENAVIQTLVRTLKDQSKQEMENFSRSLGFVVSDQTGTRAVSLTAYYQEVLDDAIVQISSGTFDAKTTLKRSVRQMTNSGLRWIDYESGHHNRVTVAARRAVTTGLSQMTQKMSEYNANQLGTDYYEVAWHANARPTHREWHGQIWNSEQLVSVCGLGTVEGLCGANCYHVYYPFIPGIGKRNWTDDWLKEQNKKEDTPKTFKGKEYTGYEATQRQRVLETRMRAQRESIQLLKDNEGDPFDIMTTQVRYRATMDEYVKFSRAMNLREQKDRIYMDGLGQLGSSKKKGLYSKREIGALKKYISSDSYKINEKLRTGQKLNDDDLEFVRLLDAALFHTKHYKGEVNRSLEFLSNSDMNDFIAQHKPGNIISYNQYISSTTDLVYNESAQIQMHLLSKTGKDIRDFNKGENEVLFSRDTKFIVNHISEKDGNYIIWLEEVKKNG